MPERSPFFRTAIFYLYAFFQGLCLILIPAASFIFKQAAFGALSDRQYGLCFLPMNAAAVLVTVFFRPLLNRFGREPLLAAGLGAHGAYAGSLLAAASGGAANSAVFFWLLAANLSLGIGFGLLISSANLAMVELYPQKRDNYLLGLHGFLGIGASLAPVAVEFFYRRGLWTVSHWSYLGLWAGLMISLFFLRPAAYVLPEIRPDADPRHLDKTASAGMPRSAWIFLAAIFIYGIAESIAGNWSSIYLTHDKGFAFLTAARCLSAFWVFLTLGRILAALAALRMDARILYRISPVVMTGVLLVLGALRIEKMAVPVYAALGFGCSYFFPLSIGLATQYHDRWRDELSSLGIAAIMAGVSFGTTLMGFLQDEKMVRIQQTFGLAAACGAVLIMIAFFLTRKKIPARL